MLSWAVVSTELVGKCHIDLYKVLQICWGVALPCTEQIAPQLCIQY